MLGHTRMYCSMNNAQYWLTWSINQKVEEKQNTPEPVNAFQILMAAGSPVSSIFQKRKRAVLVSVLVCQPTIFCTTRDLIDMCCEMDFKTEKEAEYVSRVATELFCHFVIY